ncbi:MAG TPA: hypothetical protein VJZ00_15575 [Thermoanaerobaculia bacterium]|nr:hypothetical protein [Thermoanaerobaculia bacterium]
MTNKSDWQEANRRLMAEQREKLGDPPTAEEMLAYTNGELSEEEADRIRDLLVAYPELARMYAAPFPEEGDDVSEETIAAGLQDVQRRLGGNVVEHRTRVRHFIPMSLVAALALVFFGLYVQAESRARNIARGCDLPRVLGAPQELVSDAPRGSATPTVLRKDGEAYFLKPQLINQLRFAHYTMELKDKSGSVWTTHSAEPDENDTFQVVVPHSFLREGVVYQLRIFGVDGKEQRLVGQYDVTVPSE